jgi:UDP-N-acetylmuramate dehydrogenase
MKVGGAAEWLLEPATPDELRRAVCAARDEGYVLHVDSESSAPNAVERRGRAASHAARADWKHASSGSRERGALRILGGGANLIVDDGELPGVVIATDRIKRLFRPEPAHSISSRDAEEMSPRRAPIPRDEGLVFVAWCGVSMPKLVNAAAELGWSGVECLAGVPGNVGGGIAMNAGGKWGEMWDVVERVLVIDERGELVEIAREHCSPRYRNGALGQKIVAAAVLRFRLEEIASVKERGRDYLLEKNRAQPVTESSAGCVFKNPDPSASGGLSAGKLIEHCGLKGRTRGDAIVSSLHGNFIVNRGAARASDVLALIEEVRAIVAEKTGIVLELEAKIWRAG